jgi:hypothetical protein
VKEFKRQNSELRTQIIPPNPPLVKGGWGDLNTNRRGFFLFLVLCCFIDFPSYLQAEPKIPEKFVYYIFWSGIRAGMATLDFEDTPEGITITSRATSATFISIFYRVDDVAQSTLYSDGYPNKYTMKIREGRHRRDKATYFGIKPEDGPQKVVYNNKLDNETVEFNFEKQAFDPLSGFYEIRKRPLKVGHPEYLDIFDSKKLWNVEVQVLRKERIRVPAGEFDTIVIKPLLQSEGIFMKKGEVHIWFTDDEKRIPVMIKSKVKIGSFKAKLVEGDY